MQPLVTKIQHNVPVERLLNQKVDLNLAERNFTTSYDPTKPLFECSEFEKAGVQVLYNIKADLVGSKDNVQKLYWTKTYGGYSGVYCWYCTETSRAYIGSTKNQIKRAFVHLHPSRRDRMPTDFVNDLRKYGLSAFVVRVLYVAGPKSDKNHGLAQKYEEKLLSEQDYNFLYNYYTKVSTGGVRTKEQQYNEVDNTSKLPEAVDANRAVNEPVEVGDSVEVTEPDCFSALRMDGVIVDNAQKVPGKNTKGRAQPVHLRNVVVKDKKDLAQMHFCELDSSLWREQGLNSSPIVTLKLMDLEAAKKVQAEYFGYCGIYMTVHLPSKKTRVGSAKHLHVRPYDHRNPSTMRDSMKELMRQNKDYTMNDWVLCILEAMEQTENTKEQGERLIALERHYQSMIPSHQTRAKNRKPGVTRYTTPTHTITDEKIKTNAAIRKAYKYLAFYTLGG